MYISYFHGGWYYQNSPNNYIYEVYTFKDILNLNERINFIKFFDIVEREKV